MVGTDTPLLDVHAHFFPADGRTRWAAAGADPRWPVLGPPDGDGFARIMRGDVPFRTVTRPLWDPAARIAVLDEHDVALQAVSPTPVLLTYWADPAAALDFARDVNDALARFVAAAPGRLVGLGTVPLQDGARAAEELRRLVTELGMAGVEIGTTAGGRELDDPSLDVFFAAAAELDAAVFVHPLDGGGNAIRRTGPPYDFGLGMLTDTAMAATALVTGGVLDRHSGLRVALSHGCGTLPWAAPRLGMGLDLGGAPGGSARFEELVSRLWADTLVFDPDHLGLLVKRLGAGHLMVGTDYPFIPGQLEGARALLGDAVDAGALTAAEAKGVLGATMLEFLGRASSPG